MIYLRNHAEIRESLEQNILEVEENANLLEQQTINRIHF
jgi:hypothetical protein